MVELRRTGYWVLGVEWWVLSLSRVSSPEFFCPLSEFGGLFIPYHLVTRGSGVPKSEVYLIGGRIFALSFRLSSFLCFWPIKSFEYSSIRGLIIYASDLYGFARLRLGIVWMHYTKLREPSIVLGLQRIFVYRFTGFI